MSADDIVLQRVYEPSCRSALLVLGMHRSGTSVLTGALRLCGAWVGEEAELTRANVENPWGFWERQDVRGICDRLLHAAEADWWKIASFDLQAIPHAVLSEQRRKFKGVISVLACHDLWVIKEPRLCLLLPVLHDYISDPVCVYIFRNPLEVAKSLQLRNGFSISAGLALWESYNQHALAASAGMPCLRVSHESLMLNPTSTLGRLVEDLEELSVVGLKRPEDHAVRRIIDSSLYRQRASEADAIHFLSPSQQALWERLCSSEPIREGTFPPVSHVTKQHLFDLESTEVSLNYYRARYKEQAEKVRTDERTIDNLRQQRERMNSELARRAGAIAFRNDRIESLSKEAQRLKSSSARLKIEVSKQHAMLARQEAEVERQQTEAARQRAIVKGLHNSISWKITLPLRVMRRFVERCGRKASSFSKAVHGQSRRYLAHSRKLSLSRPVSRSKRRTSRLRDVGHAPTHPLSFLLGESREKVHSGGASTTGLRRPSSTEGGIKVTVVAWNVSHNALGRAYLLADALRREYDVELIAAEFPRFGQGVWEPLRHCSRVPIKSFQGGAFPEHFKRMEDVAKEIEGDVILVSKPRLPALELAILAKMRRNRPIILDIDDYELGFFKTRQALDLSRLRTGKVYSDFHLPHHETWTRYSESLVSLFEELTVSNEELQKKFGGTVLPHIRDENDFDPLIYPRDEIRAALGFSSRDKVILFVGTPRTHKGVTRIARALKQLSRTDYKFLAVGSPVDKKSSRFYHNVDPRHVKVVPNVPFSDIPAYLSSGDLVCLLQDGDDVTSHYQMPAKFTDGLAMGIPILATDVPPLKNLAKVGLVELLGDTPLETKICEVFENFAVYKQRALRNREVFIKEYSYGANLPTLKEIIGRVSGSPAPVPGEFRDLIAYHRQVFSKDLLSPKASLKVVAGSRSVVSHPRSGALVTRRSRSSYVDDKLDVVFFWKQNDTGIYGRRQDMLVKYLAKDVRIHRILHFDAPVSLSRLLYDVIKTRKLGRHSHSLLVLTQTLKRALTFQFCRHDGVVFNTFVFLSRHYLSERIRRVIPSERHYLEYLDRILRRYRVGERRTVFWVCPRDFHFPSVVERFEPDLVVADVIDDHRTWPGIKSEYEEQLHNNYQAILSRSHIVLANCDQVVKGMREFVDNVKLLPNAAEELEEQSWHWKKPMRLSAMRGPVIGYVGNLDIARLDLALLETIAGRRSDWNLVFIGSMHRSDGIRALDRFPNVHFLGVRRYDRALRYIRHFDAAMVPHLNNELTRHMSPLKLYVYLSLYVPVVATDIENMADFAEFVRIADSPDAFIDELDFCLTHGVYSGRRHLVRRFLKYNSWERRAKEVLALIDAEFVGQEPLPPQ